MNKTIDIINYKYTPIYDFIIKILEKFTDEQIYDICDSYLQRFTQNRNYEIRQLIFENDIYIKTNIGECKVKEYEFKECISKFKAVPKPMITKPPIIVHNEKEFNSLNTILNKNIVLIKYIDKDTTLQSMTYGNYYIAEKTKDNRYKLLTRNNFDKQNSEYIHVYQNNLRYVEYPINYWTDCLYNFEMNDCIKLAPNIKRNIKSEYFDGCVFKLGNNSTKFFNEENIKDIKNVPAFKILKQNTNLTYLNSVLDGEYYYNASQQEVVERKNIFKNTHFIKGVSDQNKQCLSIDDLFDILSVDPDLLNVDYPNLLKPIDINRLDIQTQNKIKKYSKKYIEYLPKFFNIDNETIEEREHRINNTHIPINKHITDLSIGINDDYLLLD